MVGDGEAETGPLATAWHSNKFINPIRDGAVLPILHLNGYKIANPTILARITREELEQLFRGYGWTPLFVEGDEPELMHEAMAATLSERVSRLYRAGCMGRAADVAEAVLCSDAGSFSTDTHLFVDGGMTIGPRSSWDPEVANAVREALGIDARWRAAPGSRMLGLRWVANDLPATPVSDPLQD